MNSEENFVPSESKESDFKELYKNTPLKKRPIQPSSLVLDEKIMPPKPGTSAVPEGRASRRKMLKPTKKLIDSYVESTEGLEAAPNAAPKAAPNAAPKAAPKAAPNAAPKATPNAAPKATPKAVLAPVVNAPPEPKAPAPGRIKNKAVNMAMAMAIPELKKTVGRKVPSSGCRQSKALRYPTKQEWEDFLYAMVIQKGEFNLRERDPKTIIEYAFNPKRAKRQVKTKGRGDNESISSPETSDEVVEVKVKRERTSPQVKGKRTSRQVKGKRTSRRIKGERKRRQKQNLATNGEYKKDPFSGSHSMYNLSAELANIVGHKKMTSGAIIDAMHYVFLERNLFEQDKKYVICDDELSEKIFAGKRRIRFDDVKNYLHKHLTPTD